MLTFAEELALTTHLTRLKHRRLELETEWGRQIDAVFGGRSREQVKEDVLVLHKILQAGDRLAKEFHAIQATLDQHFAELADATLEEATHANH